MRTVVEPGPGRTPLRPVDAAGVHVSGGFWAERLETNRRRSIPHGFERLEASGALGNFRNAALDRGRYVGGLDDAGITFPFLDSDVYKWLEAAGWELGRATDANVATQAGKAIELVEGAQRADGYLNTFVRLSGRAPYSDLAWGHELYCVGHLTQAAIAWQRSLGDDRLLVIAGRAIDHSEGALGAGRREAIGGHPEIEMALVEAYRATGQERFLAFARLLIERRGRGLLGRGRLGARYWQDHAPIREAPTMAGHAVRQLYLECGVVDVAVETADRELLDAVLRRWSDMWASRTYLTGALGSRHRDEAFGDAYELPSDRAYAETCAAIASVMLAWRLLLATGEARFAEAIERTLYNAVLPGLSLDGTHFFYTNPLQLRSRPGASGPASGGRAEWYPCACCPPNLMRTLSSLEHLLVAHDEEGIRIAQLVSATVTASLDGAPIRLGIESGLPWAGSVVVTVDASPERPWTLRLRIPSWARAGTLSIDDRRMDIDATDGWIRLHRAWRAGDRLALDLPMAARLTAPDPRIDAIRGSVAIERGPLVYCLEQVDLPPDVGIESIDLDVAAADPTDLPAPSGLPATVAVGLAASSLEPRSDGNDWPYLDAMSRPPDQSASNPHRLVAIPYYAWANRTPGPMRVWLPVRAAPTG